MTLSQTADVDHYVWYAAPVLSKGTLALPKYRTPTGQPDSTIPGHVIPEHIHDNPPPWW